MWDTSISKTWFQFAKDLVAIDSLYVYSIIRVCVCVLLRVVQQLLHPQGSFQSPYPSINYTVGSLRGYQSIFVAQASTKSYFLELPSYRKF